MLLPALVCKQVDEYGRQLSLTNGGGADAADRHEDVGARLPHAPHPVLAQVEKFRQLKKRKTLLVHCLKKYHLYLSMYGLNLICITFNNDDNLFYFRRHPVKISLTPMHMVQGEDIYGNKMGLQR